MRDRGIGLATETWLTARGLSVGPGKPWKVTITLDDDALAPRSHLQLAIEAREWGVRFARDNQMSWIRVIDTPQVQVRDDFELCPRMPRLRDVAVLVGQLEDRFKMRLRRAHASIRSNLTGAEDKLRLWVVAAL